MEFSDNERTRPASLGGRSGLCVCCMFAISVLFTVLFSCSDGPIDIILYIYIYMCVCDQSFNTHIHGKTTQSKSLSFFFTRNLSNGKHRRHRYETVIAVIKSGCFGWCRGHMYMYACHIIYHHIYINCIECEVCTYMYVSVCPAFALHKHQPGYDRTADVEDDSGPQK